MEIAEYKFEGLLRKDYSIIGKNTMITRDDIQGRYKKEFILTSFDKENELNLFCIHFTKEQLINLQNMIKGYLDEAN